MDSIDHEKPHQGLLVHGKIFMNQNTCILASQGLIKFRGMVLHDINKEKPVIILLFGLVNQHFDMILESLWTSLVA
jgi:hypothetical protein